MFDFIIGIDGGGTKTLGVLFDKEGNEIRREELGFSNFSIDEAKSKSTIMELIGLLLLGVESSKKVFVQMGIAGASKLQDKKSFIEEIEKRYACRANLDVDAKISMYAIQKEDNESLIMAIGGTGSVVMTEKAGQINMLGGWGHLLGDGGSAYHLVIEAFKNIIKEYELDEPFSPLSKRLLEIIETDNPRKIVEFVYNKDKSSLAQLSVEIQMMDKKDEIVKKLLVAEANLLAEQIINAYKLYIKEGQVVVALRGSFSLKGIYVKETVQEIVHQKINNVRFDIYGREPVYGAYMLAKEIIRQEEFTW